jgi:hypothetical protein
MGSLLQSQGMEVEVFFRGRLGSVNFTTVFDRLHGICGRGGKAMGPEDQTDLLFC